MSCFPLVFSQYLESSFADGKERMNIKCQYTDGKNHTLSDFLLTIVEHLNLYL